MSKQTRQEKKAEEKRILAEFETALKEERASDLESKHANASEKEETGEKKKKKTSFYASADPERVHCKRCKTLMEEGVCPVCGYKIYQPMSEEKRRKIKGIITVVALAVFAVFLVFGLMKG